MRTSAIALTILVVLLRCCGAANAQAVPDKPKAHDLSVGLRLSATESNSPPGSCGCFWLQGGAADAGLPLWRNLAGVVEIAGNHTGSVPGTTRGLSTITLLAGPRYTVPLGHRQAVQLQGLFGAVRGFDAEFKHGSEAADTATAFALAAGGGYEITLRSRLQLRVIQVEYIRTSLPNGSDNSQRNLRLGVGIVFHPAMPGAKR